MPWISLAIAACSCTQASEELANSSARWRLSWRMFSAAAWVAWCWGRVSSWRVSFSSSRRSSCCWLTWTVSKSWRWSWSDRRWSSSSSVCRWPHWCRFAFWVASLEATESCSSSPRAFTLAFKLSRVWPVWKISPSKALRLWVNWVRSWALLARSRCSFSSWSWSDRQVKSTSSCCWRARSILSRWYCAL